MIDELRITFEKIKRLYPTEDQFLNAICYLSGNEISVNNHTFIVDGLHIEGYVFIKLYKLHSFFKSLKKHNYTGSINIKNLNNPTLYISYDNGSIRMEGEQGVRYSGSGIPDGYYSDDIKYTGFKLKEFQKVVKNILPILKINSDRQGLKLDKSGKIDVYSYFGFISNKKYYTGELRESIILDVENLKQILKLKIDNCQIAIQPESESFQYVYIKDESNLEYVKMKQYVRDKKLFRVSNEDTGFKRVEGFTTTKRDIKTAIPIENNTISECTYNPSDNNFKVINKDLSFSNILNVHSILSTKSFFCNGRILIRCINLLPCENIKIDYYVNNKGEVMNIILVDIDSGYRESVLLTSIIGK